MMIKSSSMYWLYLVLIFGLSYAQTLPKLVVMSSLDEPKIEEKIDRILKRKLDHRSFDVRVIHKADQSDLWNVFQTMPQALIWISHGGGGFQNSSVGLGSAPILLDYQKNNVAALFSALPFSVQFLAVIGCYAQNIVDYYELDLEVLKETYLPKKKVVATLGLKKALRKLKQTSVAVNQEIKTRFVDEDSLKINITRKNLTQEVLLPIRVMEGKKLKVLLKALNPLEEESIVIEISQKTKTLRLESSYSADSTSEIIKFGKIQIDDDAHRHWKAFSDQNGKPLGHHHRVYLPK